VNKDLKEEYNYIYHMIRDVVEINGLLLKSEHKVVLFCLETRGKQVFPSHETLAENCGFGETKVRRILKELKDFDIVNWKQLNGSSNRYRINRNAISTAWSAQLEEKVKKESQDVDEWNSFYPEWEIAGITN